MLTIDQLMVEVHARKRYALSRRAAQGVSAAAIHALFAGARSCKLMLFHKEINWRGCHSGNCGEFSWISTSQASGGANTAVDRRQLGARQVF